MVYLSILALFFLFSFTKGKRNDRLFRVGIAILLCTTCLRSPSIGIDTAGGYYGYYLDVVAGIHLNWVEPGWEPINRIAIFLGLGYQGVIAIAGILLIFPVSYVIAKNATNKCYALSLYYGMYFVLYSYNIMRQMIAVSFAFLAIHFYIHRKWKCAFFWFLVGFFFHKSILVFLPMLLFVKFRYRYFTTVVLVLFSYVIGLLLSSNAYFFLTGKYASNLLQTDGYAGFRESIIIPAIMSLGLSLFFLVITYFDHVKIQKNPWYIISLFGIIIMNLTMRVGQGTRIVLYFSQAQIIFFQIYLKDIQYKTNNFLIRLLFSAYIIANFLRILLDQWDTLNPYLFFWMT